MNDSGAGRFYMVVGGLAILGALLGCGGPDATTASPPPPFHPVATVEEVMHDVIYPSAEVIWESVGTIITIEGQEDIYPRSEDEWVAVESSATTLMEAGNLLMMEGRAKNDDSWMGRARALVDAGETVREAARDRDAEAVFVRGGYVFDACQGCHFDYRFEEDPNTIRTH